jgi:hypothetical protein
MKVKPGDIFLSSYGTEDLIAYVRDIDYSGAEPDYSCFIFVAPSLAPGWDIYNTFSTNVFNNKGSFDSSQKKLAIRELFLPDSVVLA